MSDTNCHVRLIWSEFRPVQMSWIPNSLSLRMAVTLVTVKEKQLLLKLRKCFFSLWLASDATDVFANCLLCSKSRRGARVPRLLGTTLHTNIHGAVLQFDFIFLRSSTNDDRYALLLKEYFSEYAWLSHTLQVTVLYMARVFSRWHETLTVSHYWVFDQDSHFLNEILQSKASLQNIQNKPTVASLPCVSGTIERLNHDISTALRTLPMELKLKTRAWASTIVVVPSVLNEGPSERLENFRRHVTNGFARHSR